MIKAILGALIIWPPAMLINVYLFFVGLLVISFYKVTGRPLEELPVLYRATRGIHTFWETAFRNPADGSKFLIEPPPDDSVTVVDNLKPGCRQNEMQALRDCGMRFTWRFTYSGWLSSIRLVWIWNDKKGGEAYLGWKLLSEPGALGFAMQLRPYVDD